MDVSRDGCYEKNSHKTSTITNETSSSCSSDNDQTPKSSQKKIDKTAKSSQKKKKGNKTSKQLYTPDYFPMYTPPWATMNYVYLDLLRQLSLESEIRSSLTKMDKRYDSSYFKDFEEKNEFEEEQSCDGRKKHKPYNFEDFEMSCSQLLCSSCQKKTRCSSCGQTILQNRVPETALKEIKPRKHCECLYKSCPAYVDQHIPLSSCHYLCQKSTHPCHSLGHKVCGILNNALVETPVREVPKLCKSNRKVQLPLTAQASYESSSNSDELLSENCFSVNNSDAKNFGTKNVPISQTTNKDTKKLDFEDDYRMAPSFLGGTGDEGSKLQVKRTRKSRPPQSTAYFLPISS